MHDPRLLVIDDEPASVGLLLHCLADRGLDLMVALDGADGLAKAEAGQPALVLLDVTMDGLDGYEVCRRLKAGPRTADIPVVFLSARTDTPDKLLGFEAGGVDYITKPFETEEVLARVAVQLQAVRRLQQLEAMATERALARLPGGGVDREEQMFHQACALLDRRLADPPGLVELAHMVGTNERKLGELFKCRVGLTVFDYLLEMRLGAARRMLEGSNDQVQRIADAVGYRNPGDFIRAFRRRFGVSPRQYRKLRHGGHDERVPRA